MAQFFFKATQFSLLLMQFCSFFSLRLISAAESLFSISLCKELTIAPFWKSVA
jgi:hypothetical protein